MTNEQFIDATVINRVRNEVKRTSKRIETESKFLLELADKLTKTANSDADIDERCRARMISYSRRIQDAAYALTSNMEVICDE